MKLGIGTYAFVWAIGISGWPLPPQPMDALTFLHRCAELGVRVAQFADNLPLDQLTVHEFNTLLAEAQRLGIAIEVGTRGFQPDHLHTYLHIAQRCQSPFLRVVVDTSSHHPEVPEIIRTIQTVLPAFEQANITLAIENHDRFQVRTLARIMESVASPYLGICLDTVNSFGALEGPEIVVDALGPYVVNLHLKDFTIRRASHNLGFIVEGTPAGQGRLDVPWLLDRLQRFNRDFNTILELWPAPEADVETTIRKEANWVAESIRYLRTQLRA